nr:hypothetical protein [uncultured Nocardioides sp.]
MDYFRAQRKEAYSRAVQAEYSLYNREQSYLSRLFPDGLTKPEGIGDNAPVLAFTEENAFKSDYNSLLQEHSNVLLLGSSDVASASDDLSLSHKKLVDLILIASEAPSYETASETATRADALLQASNAVIQDRSSLLHTVRTDLGIID